MPHAGLDTFELFLVAAIDASLAAQNAAVAAESLGLSIVYIGGMRDKPEAVAELVNLPSGAAVMFGLCVGYATAGHEGDIKPRLPQEAVLHRESYDLAKQDEAIARYNDAMAAFNSRVRLDRPSLWTRQASRRVAGPKASRVVMSSCRHCEEWAFSRLNESRDAMRSR